MAGRNRWRFAKFGRLETAEEAVCPGEGFGELLCSLVVQEEAFA
jgi:hypothetical protein